MRALITGIGGFVGRHLLTHLRGCDDEVMGMGRAVDQHGLPPDVPLFATDLLDRREVESALREARPEVIYHLAAQSSTGESLGDPWATLANNLHAQMTLFEALLSAGQRPSVLVIGSGDEYGRVRPEEVPTDEQVPLRPTTPYAVSKVGQDMMGHQYWAQHKLPVVRVRPFNHTGPGPGCAFRHSALRQPARRDRGSPVRARAARGQPGRLARLHRRARHGPRLPPGHVAWASRARSTTSAAAPLSASPPSSRT